MSQVQIVSVMTFKSLLNIILISFSAKCNNLLWLQSIFLITSTQITLFPTDFNVHDEQLQAACLSNVKLNQSSNSKHFVRMGLSLTFIHP